ncbi:MAG: hypothetical protein EA400_16090 [Chromatiaceae bacterium]|nr:MAG: hypothetical protein EA400_16090 [Chromatiaceae bacterium]
MTPQDPTDPGASALITSAFSADGSCRQAVDAAVLERRMAGMTRYSSNRAACSKACAGLPLAMIDTLTRRTGKRVADGASARWLWRGRHLLLADGTTI